MTSIVAYNVLLSITNEMKSRGIFNPFEFVIKTFSLDLAVGCYIWAVSRAENQHVTDFQVSTSKD